jgi:hypothetical protein
MVRHSLMYLYRKGETVPAAAADWPEVGVVNLMESEEQYSQNFCMGGPFECYSDIISIGCDDEDGLKYIGLLKGFKVVAVRAGTMGTDWAIRLQGACDRANAVLTYFDRHDVMAALGRKAYWDGLELLQVAVGYLRGVGVHASPEAMRTEAALTRAIESLGTNGFNAPKR